MRPGPSAFPRPDCRGGCGKQNGTNPGRTHRFYAGTPVLPFGYGLSYTTLTYALAASPPAATTISLAPLRRLLRTHAESGRLMLRLAPRPVSYPAISARPVIAATS